MELELTQGCVTLIDDEDADLVSAHKWYPLYVPSRDKYMVIRNRKMVNYERSGTRYLHTFLLPVKDGYSVDHINRDPLDNRRSNLRVANKQQQQLNTGPRRNSPIPYKGVSYKKTNSNYVAQMYAHGRNIHIGSFDSPTDAALAYDEYSLDYWSNIPDDPISGSYTQFLYLNFPEKHNGTIA
jgi:hypothetical protein